MNLLLVIAVIGLLAWFLRPVRSINIFIAAQPAGPEYFLVDTKMMLPGAHGKRFRNVNTALVPVNQSYKVPVDTNLNRLFGQVLVEIHHPEFQPSKHMIKRYRGQQFQFQPDSWQTKLNNQTQVQFSMPALEYRDANYRQRWERGEILGLEATRFHLWTIADRYLPLLLAQEGGSSMSGSLPLLHSLAQKFTDNSSAVVLDSVATKSLEELVLSLQKIEGQLQ